MISSVSARPPPVTKPTIPSFFQARMFDDPMLRDSPSPIASITSMAPGWSTFMNASEVIVLYQWPIVLSSMRGSRRLVGT
jgi:hypothetical protein